MYSAKLTCKKPASVRARKLARAVANVLAASALTAPLVATAADEAATPSTLDQVIVTGTRVADRTKLETLAPVDVMTHEALSNQGTTELAEALSTIAPSLSFPRPAITDGTDHIRPATLRGLAPDQTLVLVNSKRRHQSALVNVNGSIGRGSAAVDLNAIPLIAISSVEVLRDGASAQYGSDAIAGVINLRLREARDGGGASLTYGSYDTTVKTQRGVRNEHDGETVTLAAWTGFGIGTAGSLTLSAEYRDRNPTSRGDFDSRVLTLPTPEPLHVTSRYGDADVRDVTFYANAVIPVGSENWQAYGWAGYQMRDGESAAFPRLSNNANNVISIYPTGFLPKIATDITDWTIAAGFRGDLADWQSDFSWVYGRNEIDYRTEDSINGSIGAGSPLSFDSGGLEYDQLTANVSFVRQFDWGLAGPANVAIGFEGRRETYGIRAGEPASYSAGPAPRPGTTPGAQGFPGFQPANVVDEDRTAYSAYVDIEALLAPKFLGSIAARGEHYSDFGSALTGKLSGRYDFTDHFALRSTLSNGFRAPGLQQEFFTSTATNFVGGVPFEVGTFPATSAISQALGSQPLDAEKSINFSLGAVLRFAGFDATLDAYRIDIDDRIVLSENLGVPANQGNVRALLAPFNVSGARFFINGVDTKTTGIDLVLHYVWNPGPAGNFDFTVAANKNKTEVTKVPTTSVLSALNPPPPLFDRINRLTFEEGTPDSKFSGIVDWKLGMDFGSLGVGFKATRYGEVTEPGLPNAGEPLDLRDIVLVPRWLIDLEFRAGFLEDKLNLAVGADNVFDQYPTLTPIARPNPVGPPIDLNSTNATSFSRYSPFGFNGRFLYARLTYNW